MYPLLILLGFDECLRIGHVRSRQLHLHIPAVFIVLVEFVKSSNGQAAYLLMCQMEFSPAYKIKP